MPYEPYRLIPLRRRDGRVRAYTIVDESDYGWLTQWPWCMHNAGYAWRSEGPVGARSHVLIHRAICGLLPGDSDEVDHVNGRRLDNRRSNLEIKPHARNQQNRSYGYGISHFRGVSFRYDTGKWTAYAKLGGAMRNLGSFAAELDAAAAAAQWRHAHMPDAVEDPALLARVLSCDVPKIGDS